MNQKLKQFLRRVVEYGPNRDDYDWSTYNEDYSNQLRELEADYTLVLNPGETSLEGGRLRLREGLKPLLPSHVALYETMARLDPSSILEVGCGGGDHLHNLTTLLRQVHAIGYDWSEAQLDFLHRRHPDLDAELGIMDASQPIQPDKRADVVFTQAVLMHIQGRGRHVVALQNMFKMADRHVVLMENWWRHKFPRDIKRLAARGRIPWENVHLHYHDAGEAMTLVASREPLDLPPLDDYGRLRATVPN